MKYNEDDNKSLRKESKVVQTKKQYGDFSLTALSFASISIFLVEQSASTLYGLLIMTLYL